MREPDALHEWAQGCLLNGREAFLLIDHGSRRSEANALLDEVTALVESRLGPGAIVEPAHMEIAEPTIAQGFARCVARGATMIVVHPFMLAPGRHVSEDLPRLVAEVARDHGGVSFAMAPPLGSHRGIIDAVVERCRAALSETEDSSG
ncbi:MAG: CbiX/SirB N-terminal domain-containing protein [Myxococcales bacterium]|jgi:sirohydrochlorin ferrochelatase